MNSVQIRLYETIQHRVSATSCNYYHDIYNSKLLTTDTVEIMKICITMQKTDMLENHKQNRFISDNQKHRGKHNE